MPVNVEVGGVAMHSLAYPIGEPPDGENVSGAVKNQGIGLVQAVPGQYLVFDRMQTGVVSLERVGAGHRLNDTAARQDSISLLVI